MLNWDVCVTWKRLEAGDSSKVEVTTELTVMVVIIGERRKYGGKIRDCASMRSTIGSFLTITEGHGD
jgi:hypothetical protein